MSNQASLASLAVQNPMFREQAKKAAFQAVDKEENDNELWNAQAKVIDPSQLDVDEKELAEIRKHARNMKIFMIATSTLMIITAWYNIGTATYTSDSFLAIYLFFFAIMLCCFELAIRRVSKMIVQNFGFMYSAGGKVMFLAFIAMMCFELSALGKVCFALLICYCFANLYIQFKHPQYARYLRLMHYYNAARAGKKTTNDTAVEQV
jgi:hypothetical protein